MKTKNIGIPVGNVPSKECEDRICPFHGNIKLRGRVFVGRVISDKMRKTATIEWERMHFIPKFERYEKRRSRVKAHNPECINAKKNDVVKVGETRQISKTKNFVIIEILGRKEAIVSDEEIQGEMEKVRGKKKKSPDAPKEKKKTEQREK